MIKNVTHNGIKYSKDKSYDVGKDISKELADDWLDAKYCILEEAQKQSKKKGDDI